MSNPLIKIGAIESGSSARFESLLAKCDPGQAVILDIHSEGGSVFEGFRIGELLSEWTGKKIARVNVTAFSIASYIAMLCDEVEIKSVGWMMVHNPWTVAQGDDGDLEKQADMLAKLKDSMVAAYARKTGMSDSEVLALMKAETWLNAEQAVDLGFADRVIGNEKPKSKAAAFAGLFFNPLEKEPVAMSQSNDTNTTPKAATPQEIKAAFPKSSSDFVLNCIMQGLPMSAVAAQAAKSMEEENEALKAKLAEMEEKLDKAKAEYEEEKEKAKKAEEEKEEAKAKAKSRSGVAPINQPSTPSGSPSARARWNQAILDAEASGLPRSKAVLAVNRNFPGLRDEMLAEANPS